WTVQARLEAGKGGAMSERKPMANSIMEHVVSSSAIIFIGLLLSACGATTPGASSMQQVSALEAAKATMASPADDFNRSLGALGKRDLMGPADFTIGPQDLLEVNLFNIDATDGLPNKVQVRVSNNGSITLPLLGPVSVGGSTRAQVEETLQTGYGKYMHAPDVGVSLVENKSNSVYVLGAVQNPGVLPITGQETLRRALAMAGGITKDSGMFVHVSRQIGNDERSYVINLTELANDATGKLNVAVRPGDFINVPRAGSFFVDGQVERPNSYQLVQPYRLTEALTLAGGLSNYASKEITIIRRGPNGQVETLARDVDKVRSGEEEDPQIAANDLIVVPPNRAKVFLSVLLSAVGYTSRSSSYSFTAGRAGSAGGGIGSALLP
ncbi:MAG: SLBB domain-containing protein, partial [Candidatus Binatia bacterium]